MGGLAETADTVTFDNSTGEHRFPVDAWIKTPADRARTLHTMLNDKGRNSNSASPAPIDSQVDSVSTRASEWIERMFDVTLALVMVIPAVVIIVPVYILYLLTERKGGPFLFRAKRMGKDKRVFTMYKIRTMVTAAEKQIGAWHRHDKALELWYGRFLRNTKIDELPQLVNIIRGDITFVGPRPLRPADYEEMYRFIPNCDNRFAVRPGLTGYSQFYTPGSVPRKFRVLIDNHFVRKNKKLSTKYLFVIRTGIQFLLKLIHETSQHWRDMVCIRVRGKASRCRRRFPRKMIMQECVIFAKQDAGKKAPALILDISTEAMGIVIPNNPFAHGDEVHIAFEHLAKKKKRARRHTVQLGGLVSVPPFSADALVDSRVVVSYNPKTNIDAYWVHKYILRNSFAI